MANMKIIKNLLRFFLKLFISILTSFLISSLLIVGLDFLTPFLPWSKCDFQFFFGAFFVMILYSLEEWEESKNEKIPDSLKKYFYSE